MELCEIKRLYNVADSIKDSLKSSDFVAISTEVVPDDNTIYVYCIEVKPVNFININVIINR